MRQKTFLVGLAAVVAVAGGVVAGCDGGNNPTTAPPVEAPSGTPSGAPIGVPGGDPNGASGRASIGAAGGVSSGGTAGPLAAVDDPPGMITCVRLAVAIKDGNLMAPGVVYDIEKLAGTADAPVADAADRLGRAYDAALAAAGKTDEPDAIATVSSAASEMSDVRADSGLRTAG